MTSYASAMWKSFSRPTYDDFLAMWHDILDRYAYPD